MNINQIRRKIYTSESLKNHFRRLCYQNWIYIIFLLIFLFSGVSFAINGQVQSVRVNYIYHGEHLSKTFTSNGSLIIDEGSGPELLNFKIDRTSAGSANWKFWGSSVGTGWLEEVYSSSTWKILTPTSNYSWYGTAYFLGVDDDYIRIDITEEAEEKPDLIISNPSPNISAPYEVDQEIRWQVVIQNKGPGKTKTSGTVRYYLGNSSSDYSNWIKMSTFTTLNDEETATKSEYYTFKESDIGTKYLNVWVDPGNDIIESNEGNNKSSYGPFEVIDNTYILNTSVSGSGNVSKNPDKSEYNQNESVTLTATPSSGWQFINWSGDLSGSTNPVSITMNSDKSVTAAFTEIPETISTPNTPSGSSSGKAGQSLSYSTGGSTSNLGHDVEYRFNWGDGSYSNWGSSSQSHTYTTVNSYTVRAQARCQIHTDKVSGWSSGKSVSISGHALDVSTSGSGSVSKSPNKNAYNHNESVTLKATASSNWYFNHWSGDLSSSSDSVTITMNSDKSVTAAFTEIPETISTPNTPSGSSSGKAGQSLSYTTGGSVSNLGHTVEYRFDWGDGSYSGWVTSSQSHTWTTVGSYTVKAQARCQTHTDKVSGWSFGKTVDIDGHSLTVNITGSGSVSKSPNKSKYNHNEEVNLTPSPLDKNWKFSKWQGDLTGSDNPGNINMNSDKNVTAVFVESEESISEPELPNGPVSGKVGQVYTFRTGNAASNLDHAVEYRFDWGDGNYSAWGDSSQSYTYQEFGVFYIKAQARCTEHTDELSLWSDSSQIQIAGHTLHLIVNGAGNVYKTPDQDEYDHNSYVLLTPEPSDEWEFGFWGGDLSGNANPDSIFMDGDKSVEATFIQSQEEISTPSIPAGNTVARAGTSLGFTTGSVSSLGHDLEYRFDWGNGTYSTWGDSSRTYTFKKYGSFHVKSQARCATDTLELSNWSEALVLSISGHNLNISVEGSGSVTKSPDQSEYDDSASVQLIPMPADTTWKFSEWQGDLTGDDNPANLMMDANKNITAIFNLSTEYIFPPDLVLGPATATVGNVLTFNTVGSSSNLQHVVEYRFDWGDGNYSSWGDSVRTHIFKKYGTFLVKAQARCASHTDELSSWCEGLSITVSGHQLSISIEGSGSVTKTPNQSQYDDSVTVTLTPVPSDTNWVFDSWEDDLDGNANPATLLLDSSKSIVAIFKEISTASDPEPVIVFTEPSNTVSTSNTMSLSCVVSNCQAIKNALLFYKTTGASNFLSKTMETVNDTTFEGQIPSDYVTERGVSYYFQIEDSSGRVVTNPAVNPTDQPYTTRVSYSFLSCPNSTPSNSYRMIAIPGVLDSATPASVLEDDLGKYDDEEWRLYRYQNGALIEYTVDSIQSFEPGNAFWLITKESASWDVGSGKSSPSDQAFAITLKPGWNQIGSPFAFAIDWSEVQFTGNVEAPVLYEGNGNSQSGYQSNQPILMPWTGYAIKNNESSDVIIHIPPVESLSNVSKQKPISRWIGSSDDWILGIKAECGNAVDTDNYLGCLENANDGWDANDYSEPPPIGNYVSLYFDHRKRDQYPGKYSGDFRSLAEHGRLWQVFAETNQALKPVSLRIHGLHQVPESYEILLFDHMAQIVVDLGKQPNYQYIPEKNENLRQFTIAVGSQELIRSEACFSNSAIPACFYLSQNYPNPFNSSTRLQYEIPETGNVCIFLYNIQGRKIRTFKDEMMSGGRYEIRWDGRDDSGNRVTSGLYFIQMQANDFHTVKKIVLTK